VILEADGRETHDQLLARADDKARQRHLEQHGYHVLRVTWRQATLQPVKTRERLRAALEASASRSGNPGTCAQPRSSCP
jgi:very-short-patch-repair endonuclease